jgi:nitrate/nitrite transporter NarK
MDSSTHITITVFRGWLVTFSAACMGLVMGVLYVWSVVKGGIPEAWGWSNADKALPYSTMCIVFSIIMVPAGVLQDRYGPRWLVILGGFLSGLGCIVSGLGGDSIIAYVIGFGVLTGAGAGFGYSALTPTAIKWFPPQHTGRIAGIVVAGFGLAPVLLAPLTAMLLKFFSSVSPEGYIEPGVSSAMIVIGLLTWLVVGVLCWFIVAPPMGFAASAGQTPDMMMKGPELEWKQMLGTAQFWLLFSMYFAGASAGLVFISVASDLAKNTLGAWAFLAVVVLAFGNTAGLILAGIISDKIGRQWTLFGEFSCQCLVIATLFWVSKNGGGAWPIVLFVVFMIGLNYGANLTLFPAACKDNFGLQNFGVNYGCLYAAFGTAGSLMPWLNGFIKDVTGKPDLSYILIMAILVIAAIMALVSLRLGPPKTT